MYLVDSDILIDALRRHEPTRSQLLALVRSGQVWTSGVTLFEVLGWARDDRQTQLIEGLLAAIGIWPLDEPAARAAAAVNRMLEAAGLPIGARDCMIAGVAISRGVPLLTRNVREFERVPGLELVSLG